MAAQLQVTIIIPILRHSDYEQCRVPSAISSHAIAVIRASRLQGMSARDLAHHIKRHLLGSVAHKGKLVGLHSDSQPTGSLVAVDPAQLTLGRTYRPVLEHFNDTLPELLDHLSRRTAALRARHGSLLVPALSDRLSRDLAWTSDAIEGTSLTADEARCFDFVEAEQRPQELLDDDRAEFLRHWQTIHALVLPLADAAQQQQQQRLDVSFMKQLHSRLAITSVHESQHGQYRTVRVTVRGTTNPGFAEPGTISEQCEAMFDQLYSPALSSKHAVEQAAWLHSTFIQIHPFLDGNGRVGRLLMNALLVQRGYPLVSIQPGIRDLYFHSLRVVRWIRAVRDSGTEPAVVAVNEFGLLQRIVAEAALRSVDIAASVLELAHTHRV